MPDRLSQRLTPHVKAARLSTVARLACDLLDPVHDEHQRETEQTSHNVHSLFSDPFSPTDVIFGAGGFLRLIVQPVLVVSNESALTSPSPNTAHFYRIAVGLLRLWVGTIRLDSVSLASGGEARKAG